MPTVGNFFDTINALRQPSVIAAMQGLSGVAKTAALDAASNDEEQNQSDSKVSLHVDGAGKPRLKADIPLTDPQAHADDIIQSLNQGVEQNIGIHKRMLAKASDEAVTNALSSFGGAFHASMELGGNPLKALVDAIRLRSEDPANIQPGGKYFTTLQGERSANAAAFQQKALAPEEQTLLAESKAKLSEERLTRLVGKDNASTIARLPYWSWDQTQDMQQGAAALGKTAEQLTPQEQNAVRIGAVSARRSFETQRAKTAADTISKLQLQDVAGLEDEDSRGKFAQTVASTVPGGMTPQETDRLNVRLNGLTKRYKALDDQEKMRLRIENDKAIAAEHQNSIMAQGAAAAQNPQMVAGAVSEIEKDPGAYYTPEFNGKENSAFKQAVQNALVAAHGRVPAKPNAQDQTAITFARLGLRDVNAIDQMTSYAEQKFGVPLTGAVIGRYNEAEGKFGSPVTSVFDLRRLDPNFNKLSPDQQNEYVKLAQNVNATANLLLTRETKLATGGRGGQYMLPILKQSTPGLFTGGAVRAGRLDALRREFNNRMSVAREDAWGGIDPLTGQSSQTTSGTNAYTPKVITDPKALDAIFGSTKRKQ